MSHRVEERGPDERTQVAPRGFSKIVQKIALLAILLCGLEAIVSIASAGDEVRRTLTRAIEITHEEAAADALDRGGEVFQFRWKLGGLLGVLAGLFVPHDGDALLTFVPVHNGERVEIELLVTAPNRDGEFFLYGAEVDQRTGSTLAVWESQFFRGEGKSKEQDIDEADVIDFASVLYRVRRSPPEVTIPMTIWNGGKTYPVVLQPLGVEKRKVSKQKMPTRGFSVLGVEVDGESSFKDKMFVYFLEDEGMTPAQIVGKRGLIRVKAFLTDSGRE